MNVWPDPPTTITAVKADIISRKAIAIFRGPLCFLTGLQTCKCCWLGKHSYVLCPMEPYPTRGRPKPPRPCWWLHKSRTSSQKGWSAPAPLGLLEVAYSSALPCLPQQCGSREPYCCSSLPAWSAARIGANETGTLPATNSTASSRLMFSQTRMENN